MFFFCQHTGQHSFSGLMNSDWSVQILGALAVYVIYMQADHTNSKQNAYTVTNKKPNHKVIQSSNQTF